MYCGITNSPERRLVQHLYQTGAKYTKLHGVKEMRLIKKYVGKDSRSKASRYERYIKKKLSRKEKQVLFKSGTKVNLYLKK